MKLMEQFKDIFIPQVSVTESIKTAAPQHEMHSAVKTVIEQYGLISNEIDGNLYKLQIPGGHFVDFSQIKVAFGSDPNVEKYHCLSSYLTVLIQSDGNIEIKSFEHMILATEKEKAVFKEVLKTRINQFKAYLFYQLKQSSSYSA